MPITTTYINRQSYLRVNLELIVVVLVIVTTTARRGLRDYISKQAISQRFA